MTYHRVPSRTAKGHRPNQHKGQKTSPRISASLPPELLEALAEFAEGNGVTVAQVIREAIEHHLIRQGALP
jgi:hypothetical protein